MPWRLDLRQLRSRLRDEQGQSLVEFAITFSILIGFAAINQKKA